ncbi:MAG: OmpA family protein [Myxococcota bacterium]|nr:OmpA family protein [Myxococcota bacterium]
MTGRILAGLIGTLLLCSGCATTLPMVRADHDLLRTEVHGIKTSGAMDCAPLLLARAQLAYRFATMEIGQGDFERASQHIAEGRAATRDARNRSEGCRSSGIRAKDLSLDPWPDADGDGVADSDDLCPYGLEDRDGFADGDGCPELDNDGDGVLDSEDKCPVDAEDIDGREDEDGCPENDDDGDGVADEQDACPEQPETLNGIADEDGCPDFVPRYLSVSSGGLSFNEPLRFLARGSELTGSGPRALEELAQLMLSSPEVRISVVAHTHNRGDASELKVLSEERAARIVKSLVAAGVAPERIDSEGMGGEMPLATNRTRSGREKNERVDVTVVAGSFGGVI